MGIGMHDSSVALIPLGFSKNQIYMHLLAEAFPGVEYLPLMYPRLRHGCCIGHSSALEQKVTAFKYY